MVTGGVARRPFGGAARVVSVLVGIWFVCVTPTRADACELSVLSPWFATEAELVATTPEIFVGRVVGVRSSTRPRGALGLLDREYEFEVLERLQGSTPDRVWVGTFLDVPSVRDPRVDPLSRGRASYDSGCGSVAQFVSGQRYLVFRDAFHPKGYELIEDDRDPWLQRVQRLVRIRTTGATLPEFCNDVPAPATGGAASPPAGLPIASDPIAVDELEIVTQLTRATIGSHEPIEMVVTFRNRADHAIRTPDRIERPNIVPWTVALERVADGTHCTGGSLVQLGQLRPGDITPVVLQPGESRSATVSFEGFVFADGATSREAAANVFRRSEIIRRADGVSDRANDPRHPFTVPPGIYRASLVVMFPAFPTYSGVPADVRDEIARLAADPVPMWIGRVVRSAPVEITISPEPRLPR